MESFHNFWLWNTCAFFSIIFTGVHLTLLQVVPLPNFLSTNGIPGEKVLMQQQIALH
jgi:hypothetical protein